MVAFRSSRAVRGQRHAELLLGIAEVPDYGTEGQSEYPGMPLLADGREGDAAGRGTPGDSRAIPVADDFPDLQRLRHVAVQEDRAGHPQPRRGALETCDAPAAIAAHRRGHVTRSPRAR